MSARVLIVQRAEDILTFTLILFLFLVFILAPSSFITDWRWLRQFTLSIINCESTIVVIVIETRARLPFCLPHIALYLHCHLVGHLTWNAQRSGTVSGTSSCCVLWCCLSCTARVGYMDLSSSCQGVVPALSWSWLYVCRKKRKFCCCLPFFVVSLYFPLCFL